MSDPRGPRRGLVASGSVNANDRRRVIEAGRRLGFDLVERSVSSFPELDAALEEVPDAEVLLADFLPDAESEPGITPGHVFGLVAGEDSTSPEERAAGHARVANLRWIQIASVGINQEAGSYVWRELPNITITTASGLPSIAMAQYVIAAILDHAHGFGRLGRYRAVRDWSVRSEFQTRVLLGTTLGLLGYGGVGRRAAHIARSLGMRVIAVRRSGDEEPRGRYRRPEIEALDSGPEPAEIWGVDQLDRLLRESDYLACTLPLTPETEGLIGARELALLRPTAFVINISRGPVFDERALIAALREGRLAGAALDVFETEPLPADSALWDLPNVLITPHASGTHTHVSEYTADLFIANLERYVAGEPLLNVADRARGY